MRKAKSKLLTERLWFKRVHPTPLIWHLQALYLLRQEEPTRRKRVAFMAAVCRRLFPLLDRPYIAKPVKKFIGDLEAYAQGTTTPEELLDVCSKWEDSKLTDGMYMWDENNPFLAPFCERWFSLERDEHQKKLRTQDLPPEMKTRVHLGTQTLHTFSRDFEYAARGVSNMLDRTDYLIQGYQSAALAVSGIEAATELAVQCGIIRDIFGNPFHKPPKFDKTWRTSTVTLLARQMHESCEFSAMAILADALQDAGCDNTDILAHCRDASQPHVRGCWVVDLVLGM